MIPLEQTAAQVERARAGDRGAREALFRTHAPMALRLALALTRGHRADAEDLTQDAFVRIFDRLDDLREPARFGAWLLKTVRNLAFNQNRSAHSRIRAVEAAATEPTEPSADALAMLEEKERVALVQSAMARTPDTELKETARLFYLEGLDSTRAVAARLGVPKSTVTTRLARFRSALRKTLLAELARRGREERTDV